MTALADLPARTAAEAALHPIRDATSFGPLHIRTDRCKGCELCIEACPAHVLELNRAVVNALGHHPIRLTNAAACTSCALCVRTCPDAVFTVYARPRAIAR